MAKPKKPRKSGKPAQLEMQDEVRPAAEQSPEEFVKEMFGDAAQPQDGLPSMEWLKAHYKTKSAAIRYLVHEGFEIKRIAKHLGIRHQHVRNVAIQPLKRGPNEDWRPKPIQTAEED
ncbi:MAG: hypothetical protein E6Q97_36425 [Desulfurellales bacterium]|nr:MAG: hypothetical protein E6Q97_36425 [Desulfurellales bacterium]